MVYRSEGPSKGPSEACRLPLLHPMCVVTGQHGCVSSAGASFGLARMHGIRDNWERCAPDRVRPSSIPSAHGHSTALTSITRLHAHSGCTSALVCIDVDNYVFKRHVRKRGHASAAAHRSES